MDGNVVQIIEFQHVKPGKGAAFVRTKIRNVITGAVVEKTFSPTDKFPTAYVERKDMQYLYNDGDLYYFMDNETYENIPINASILGDIEKAINASDIGIHPNNDGKVIRLNFPPLDGERRKELVKEVSKRGEEAKVAVRGVRRDSIERFKKQKKAGEITEDGLLDLEDDIQKLTDRYIKLIDTIVKEKEDEILEV